MIPLSSQQQCAQRLIDTGDGRVEGEGCALVVVDLRGPLDVETLRVAAGSVSLAGYRIVLLREAETEHALVLTCPTLAADAATLRLHAQHLLDRYDDATHEPRGLAYADVVAWREELLREPEAEDGKRYWLKHAQACAFEPARLPFEADAASTSATAIEAVVASSAGLSSMRFDASHIVLQDVARTPAFWIACLQALLHRLSNGTRFVTGVISDGRRFDELKDVPGPLDRTLPLACLVSGTRNITENVAVIDAVLHEHAAWQEYYDETVQHAHAVQAAAVDVNDARPESGAAWHVGFAHRVWPALSVRPPLTAKIARLMVAATGAPLELVVQDDSIELLYDRGRFSEGAIREIGQRLLTLAAEALAHPGAPLDALSLLAREERDQIVHDWNATHREFTAAAAPHSLTAWLDDQAARTPDAVAVCDADGAVSYAALHARANAIARRLQRLHVGAESRVGVWMPRSTSMVASLLGTLKAGAAYVPLDPGYPAGRLAFQLTDARVAVVLTTTACAPAIPAGPYAIEVVDAPALAEASAPEPAPDTEPRRTRMSRDQLAYVIYTSGSTGQPKGAMNTHRGIVNRLAWMQETYALAPHDRVLQKTSISFDVSVWELFWPLVTGATLVVAKPGVQQDPSSLAEAIAREQVTVMHFVPAMLDAFVAADGLASCGAVRLMISSGEALSAALAARCRASWRGRLDNLYGPTEAAVDVTWHPCDADAVPSGAATVPIGRPVANTQVYVRDLTGQPAAVGTIGELYLGGVQVGRGYLDRPDLTAERFLPDPFAASPGARLYRTGDLARYRPDGAIDYIGRADQQVKLHGNRIELGEIEAALRRLPDVRDAVVLLREDEPGATRLVAYIVSTSPGLTIAADRLQEELREQLPEYMVPAVVVSLAAFPLTPNGKVDRRSLPAPSSERPTLTAEYAEPRSPFEIALAGIWASTLRVDRVGIHDNFFALGGDSIMSLQVVARATQAGWRLSPRLIFDHPTIAALASVATISGGSDVDQAPLAGSVPLTPIQHWFFSHPRRAPQHFNQAVRAEMSPEMLPLIDAAWLAIQRHHDALRFRFTNIDARPAQTGTDADTAAPASTIDLRSVAPDALARIDRRVVAAAQRSLDLARGPVARAVVLLANDRTPHVLFVIHHLVVDGVSWRILLEDARMVMEQLAAGRAPALPPKTSSLRDWAAGLTDTAAAAAFEAQRAFWTEAIAPAALLPRERASEDEHAQNTIRLSRSHQAALTIDETRILLRDLPARGGAVADALVAALVHALAGWTRERTWRIDLEGHGREALSDAVDLSRTIGWFTSLYPVRLTVESDIASTWRAAARVLRDVPLNGIGYGVLRHLRLPAATPLHDDAPAEILFNYLGQVDELVEPAAGAFRAGAGPTGAMRDPDGPREYLLEVSGIVAGRQLRLTWTYGPRFEVSTIARLADSFLAHLRALLQGMAVDDDELRRMARLLDQGTVA